MYCASNCEDLCEVAQHVKNQYPNVKIGATGISMGGLILGNYKLFASRLITFFLLLFNVFIFFSNSFLKFFVKQKNQE